MGVGKLGIRMAVETIQRVCAKIGERSPLSADLKTKWGAAQLFFCKSVKG